MSISLRGKVPIIFHNVPMISQKNLGYREIMETLEWMEEILHHQKDGWNMLKPSDNGINYLSTSARFRNRPQYNPFPRSYYTPP